MLARLEQRDVGLADVACQPLAGDAQPSGTLFLWRVSFWRSQDSWGANKKGKLINPPTNKEPTKIGGHAPWAEVFNAAEVESLDRLCSVDSSG